MSLAAALLVVFAGLAVGATSIGGILVVPVLTSVANVPLREAIAASNFSFAFTGLAALLMQRAGSHPTAAVPRPPVSIYWSALAGATLGAITLPWLPSAAARMAVAVLALVSGVSALRTATRSQAVEPASARIPAPVVVGLLVGCGSAWSGTGGPVMLLPILLLARVSPPLAVAAGQGMQLPIAGATAVVNLASGQLNLMLGLGLGAMLMAGWFAGWRMARRIPVAALRGILACGLIAVGLWYGWQTLKELLP